MKKHTLLITLAFTFITTSTLFVPLSSAEEAYSTEVHINEFIPNPVGDDTALEFIELYNSSSQDITLDGWVIDTGGTATFTIAVGTTISAGGFLTFMSAGYPISLTNSGDHIQFIRPDSVVQDDISYASSKEGHSYIRTGAGTYEDTSIPTPNAPNVSTPTPSPTPFPTVTVTPTPSASPIVYSSNIHVWEFLPNPVGDDNELEFVELYNASDTPVDISGWMLDTGATSTFSFSDGTALGAMEFKAFFSSSHDISLSNSSDRIKLIRPDNVIQDDIVYTSSKEGHSYNRIDTGSYEQSFTPTPGQANVMTASPTPTPRPTSEEDEEKDTDTDTQVVSYDFSSQVVINELLPNPLGSDEENEFIELKNIGSKPVRLFGWTLDDSTKGSPYRFAKNSTIVSGKILLLYRRDTNIALNNDTDTISLFDPRGKVIAKVTYQKPVSEGNSWNRTNGTSFVWSASPTPGKENTTIVQSNVTPSPKPSPPSRRKTTTSTVSSRVSLPIVLGATTATLPWPSLSPSPSTSDTSFNGRQQLFILFGGSIAFAQLISGIFRKEAIWRR